MNRGRKGGKDGRRKRAIEGGMDEQGKYMGLGGT